MGFYPYQVVGRDKNKAPFAQIVTFTQDRQLFENISHAKKLFVAILSSVGNRISQDSLHRLHKNQKGIKISQGNELQHCPYQVLDIVRDFDVDHGLNIRFLYWWGRGAYLLIYLGSQHPKLKATDNLLWLLKNKGYDLCKTNLWNYKEIIDSGEIMKSENIELKHLSNHINSSIPFQIIKPIQMRDKTSLEDLLEKEINDFITWMC